jgi:nucleolar MIF4G domain-containing protein 1
MSSEHTLALQVAEQQKMNTSIRKAIFTILMTSEDYMDAYQNLTKLKLKSKQQRDIARVVIHCVSHETSFNPYYAWVGKAFIDNDRSFSITFMYCLWDILKELDSYSQESLSNLARFFAFLISHGCLDYSALKVSLYLNFFYDDCQCIYFLDDSF